MISFLYLIGSVILILAWITMIGIIIMPIYMFSNFVQQFFIGGVMVCG